MNSNRWTHEDFLEELFKRNTYYKNNEFTVIGVYNKAKEDIIVKDRYGLHKISCERLLKNQPLSARTSINLKEYFYKYLTKNIKNFKIKYENFLNVSSIEGVFVCSINTKYGICCISVQNIIKGAKPSIKSAKNKTDYFVKQLQEKFGSIITNYSEIEYISASEKVLFYTEFGLCEATPNSLLSKDYKNIKIVSSVDKTEYFKNVIIKERGDEYDLTKVYYVNNTTPVIIGCKKHGFFEVVPSNFIGNKKHRGCPKCGRESTIKHVKENPIGWSYSNWQKAGKVSKNFDSFKVYIIKCWNKEEEFYKIGRTYLRVDRRFRSKKLPYNYIIEDIFIHEDAEFICKLESDLKNKNIKNKYTPEIDFEGRYECFSNIEDISGYINLIKDKLKMEQQ